jgi:putative oxidoreductase
MKKAQIVIQMLLGLIFVVFGLNKFIGFIALPQLSEVATNFMVSLGSTGYMFPTIGIIEILCGLSLLLNRYVTLSLLLLIPITFNILGFHLTLDHGGLLVSIAITSIHIYLLCDLRSRYSSLFKK